MQNSKYMQPKSKVVQYESKFEHDKIKRLTNLVVADIATELISLANSYLMISKEIFLI